jgi:hypothetical protein
MKCAMFAVLTAVLVLAGCRREDVREFTLTIPSLHSTNQATIAEALARYNGIRKDSYKWDLSAKTLTLSYDSMQIAKENIRQAIEARNIEVKR